ncbi:MAG: T9SS type A sorting domain-containing protein [Saprospiraceae bacterium]|nr:T9SS type A sorting domain-containing protein [Saprospiraceae bacterium]
MLRDLFLLGMSLPAWFCVNNSNNPVKVNVHYISSHAMGNDTCSFEFEFVCPGPDQKLCCDSTSVQLMDLPPGPGGSCCYDVHVNSNQPKCFSQICFSASTGNFTNIIANTGWNATSTPNGICFIPTGLFVPSGPVNPGSFCLNGASNPVYITVDFYDLNGMLMDSCRKVITKECSSPPEPCNCDSLQANIQSTSAMPGLCCYELNANIPSANCFRKVQLLLSAGQFSNVNANSGFVATTNNAQDICFNAIGPFFPAGNITPGSFCVTGAAVYQITVLFFYNNTGVTDTCIFRYSFDCPTPPPLCLCDSISTQILQTSQLPGVCCYDIQATIPGANCISHMELQLTSGSFSNVQTATGWTATVSSPQTISLTHSSGFVPPGFIQPVNFCVVGSNLHTITVIYYLNSGGVKDTCVYSQPFDCPPVMDTLCVGTQCPSMSRAWQTVALGLTQVYDLEVYQCKLIVAGQFTMAGNVPVNNIAAWDGTNWTPLAQGVSGIVSVLEVHNGLLFVGGQFNTAGNLNNVNNLASWNGISWSHLDNGVTATGGAYVTALKSTPNGLLIGGNFNTAGLNSNLNCQNITSWNGNAFVNNYNNGFNGPVYTISEFNGQLIAGGSFTFPHLNIAAWNGSTWNNLSGGINLSQQIISRGVFSQFVYNNNLLVGGQFINTSNVNTTQNIAVWNGFNWFAIPGGDIPDTISRVNDFLPFNGKLYVGGEFNMVANQSILGVAEWNGVNWSTTNHLFKVTRALEAYDSCGALSCDMYSGGEGFLNRWICVTSVNDQKSRSITRLYPNPTRDILKISWSENLSIFSGTIEVRDLQGKTYKRLSLDRENIDQISIQNLPPGCYLLELQKIQTKPEMYIFMKF